MKYRFSDKEAENAHAPASPLYKLPRLGIWRSPSVMGQMEDARNGKR
jgi:hypothetical protein